MTPVGVVGWSAVGVLVVLWLVISFSAASARRTVLEWLGADSLYVALSCLFLSLVLRAHAADNTFALIAFAFLLAIFTCGLCVSLINTLRAFSASDPSSNPSATH